MVAIGAGVPTVDIINRHKTSVVFITLDRMKYIYAKLIDNHGPHNIQAREFIRLLLSGAW